MTKRITGLVLAMALFGGVVLADDGNMGDGGYTGCDGNNPPPTCCDTTGTLGQTCGQGGYASTQTQDPTITDAILTTTVIDSVTDSLGLIY